ncbi:DUF4912 domain-containing protein [Phosphitispora sp. TUW77]|uniref:DUF4912 domain-containing protein n=1 Tax=Phosphitispora sp. TUW77 TaxID=3152361 RepID=UPI003AB53F7F
MSVSVPEYGFPACYCENSVMLLVRDPHCIFAYWEISSVQMDLIAGEFGRPWGEIPLKLIIYDLTGIGQDRDKAHDSFNITVHSLANNYYINDVKPNHSYCADLGVVSPDGIFVCLLRSDVVQTPRDSLADGSGIVMADLLERLSGKPAELTADQLTFSSDSVYANYNTLEREED